MSFIRNVRNGVVPRDEILRRVAITPSVFLELPDEWREDTDVAIQAVWRNAALLPSVPLSIRKCWDFVFSVVGRHVFLARDIAWHEFSDTQVLALVRERPEAFPYLPPSFRSSAIIGEEAVLQNPGHIRLLETPLRQDHVLRALSLFCFSDLAGGYAFENFQGSGSRAWSAEFVKRARQAERATNLMFPSRDTQEWRLTRGRFFLSSLRAGRNSEEPLAPRERFIEDIVFDE